MEDGSPLCRKVRVAVCVFEAGPGECSQEILWKILLEMSRDKNRQLELCYVNKADCTLPDSHDPPAWDNPDCGYALLCLLISYINEDSSAGYGGAHP